MGKHRATEPAATDFDAATSVLDDVSGDYVVDVTHTRLGFRARHAMVTTVRGSFTDFTGAVHLDAGAPANSTVDLQIATASIDTGTPDRDAHLRSPDFLDVETFPRMTFVSTDVQQVGDTTYRVAGDLTIKDVTRPVTIDFELEGSARDPFGNLRVGFTGAVVVRRGEWGLVWNTALETGGVLVSDKVQLEFDVSVVQQSPAAED